MTNVEAKHDGADIVHRSDLITFEELQTPIPMLPFHEDDEEMQQGQEVFKQQAANAVALVERVRGVEFTADEKTFLDSLATYSFRINSYVTAGTDGYKAGKAAFTYGLAEVAAGHDQGRDITAIPARSEFEHFRRHAKPALAQVGIAGIAFGDAEDSFQFESRVNFIHNMRTDVLNKKELGEYTEQDPYKPLGLPIYAVAKAAAYHSVNFDMQQHGAKASDFLTEELERTMVLTTYAEGPPNRTLTPEDITFREYWTRMVTLGKDYVMRDFLWPAFVFGNRAIGAALGETDYGKRFREGTQVTFEDFFPNSQNTPLCVEATPKSVFGAVEKVFKQEDVFVSLNQLIDKYKDELEQKYNAHIGDENGTNHINLPQQEDPRYYVAIRERILALSYLIDLYARGEDKSKYADIEEWLGEIKQKIQSSNDLYRIRAYFAEGALDQLCADEDLYHDANASLLAEVRFASWAVPPDAKQTESFMAPLSEMLHEGASTEVAIDMWYQRFQGENERVMNGVFVHKPIKVKGKEINAEIQLLRFANAADAWRSRRSFKAYVE